MKKLLIYLIALFPVLFFTACKKQDGTFKDYVVPGGTVYAGKANGVLAQPGYKRMRLVWARGADPSVTSANVSWDNGTSSLDVTYPATGDSISVIIPGLEEKSYSFIIKTFNSKGNPSIPVELQTKVYGDSYQSGISNRSITNSMLAITGSSMTINWGAADLSGGATATEVKYVGADGVSKTQRFPITESSSTVTDIKVGSAFEYRTVYRPDSLSLDNFNTAFQLYEKMEFAKTNWSVIAFSSQHSDGDNAAANIIDGTFTTRWHTLVDGVSKYPHFVTVDMKAVRTITQFSVWRTNKDVPNGDDRGPDKFQLLVSEDNVVWIDLGLFDFNRFKNGEQSYAISAKPKARYFKFIATAGASPYMVLGEISAFGF
jgi:hypothetical protein